MAKPSGISILLFYLSFLFYTVLSGSNLFAAQGKNLDESQVKAAITTHIEKHMTWPRGSVRITLPYGIPEIPPLLADNCTLEVKENRNDEFIGSRLYQVKIWHKNRFYKQLSVSIRIEVCKELALSARPLEKDQNISAQDVLVVKKWFSRLPRDLVTDPEQIIGKRLIRSIRERSTFTPGMLSEPIMFKKGKVVKIICDNDSMSISTLGLAEEEGTFGATVRVKNISSNKVIHAKVIGNSVVKVEI